VHMDGFPWFNSVEGGGGVRRCQSIVALSSADGGTPRKDKKSTTAKDFKASPEQERNREEVTVVTRGTKN